jgi:ATPase subunit of ABC transporter with duplicated ATPase domains
VLLEAALDGTIQKKAIEKCNPEFLSLVDKQKNSSLGGKNLVNNLDNQLTDALKTENHSHDKDKVQDALAMLSNIYDNIDKANADQNKKIKELSGGEKNRVHLAKMLKEEGNVLLLDEPTNDLDVNTLQALERALLDFAGCAVVISHDRYFLDRICTHILAFEGDSKVTWFEGNFQDYHEDLRRRLGDKADVPQRITYKKLTRD